MRLPLVRQTTPYTCGPAALRAALSSLGTDMGESDLAARLETRQDGTDPQSVARVARELGFHANARRRMTLPQLQSLSRRGVPVVCYVRLYVLGSHWVTVSKVTKTDVWYLDPLVGSVEWMCRERWLWIWDVWRTERYQRYGVALHKARSRP